MPVEIIGMIGVKPEGADGAAVHVIGGAVDSQWVRAFAQAHENGRLRPRARGVHLHVGRRVRGDGYAAAHTERLSYLIAHRPGFVAPTLTARAAGHAGPRDERARRAAHHHGRQRRRADP
jgi:alkanesulfonate monooxygenase